MHAYRSSSVFDGERFLAGGATVLVDGDRIAGVESFGHALPHDVEVTEYAGTLLPGLIDCHVHLVADSTVGGLERTQGLSGEEIDAVIADSLRIQACSGVTAVRDLGDIGYRTLAFRDQPGLPRVFAAGPPLTIPDGHCHFLGGVVNGTTMQAAVDEHAERGVDVIKVMASGGFATPNTDQVGAQFEVAELRELVEHAHAADLRVLAHAHSLVGMERAVEAGVDGIEHFSSLSEQGFLVPDALLERIAEASITVDPTFGQDWSKITPLDKLPTRVRELAERAGFTPEKLRQAMLDRARRLRSHGIRIVSGLDAGVGPGKPHGDLWRAVVMLTEAGWPVADALATATSVAAEDCGVDTGRLAVGFAADMLAVDGDLATDPQALARPVAVLLGGGELLRSPRAVP